MDKRPLQLAAALVLLVGLLGVSTALVKEVREEILHASRAEQDLGLAPPDGSGGLPISEFTLLDPANARLNGVSRQGNVLKLSENSTLFLEQGDSIRVPPMQLPGNNAVTFPRSGTYRGALITCAGGCTLEGDVGRVTAPPNASLVLPPGTRLPIPDGQVPAGTLLDLPPDTRLFLAPITMGRDTQVPLAPGTSIVLPSGADVAIGGPDGPNGLVELPKDTIVKGPLGGGDDGPDIQELLRRQDPTLPPAPPPPAAGQPQGSVIEVTEWPEAIRKGAAFQVAGFVQRPDGSPSPDHPVTIYANASKRAPGFVVCLGEVRTGADGTFNAVCRLDQDRPAQPYHIVAKAHARPDAAPPMLIGWSDPIVGVQAQPRLELRLPEIEGVQVPVALQARLVDEFGAAVPGQEITFAIVDTEHRYQAVTDRKGEAFAVHDAFPFPGRWQVEAQFVGTEHLAPAEARGNITIIDARIQTTPTLVVPRGSPATIPGTVILDGRTAPGVTVIGTYARHLTAEAVTGPDGRFELDFEVPASLETGNYTMELRTQGVTAKRSVVVTVTGQTLLDARPPTVMPLGGTLPLTVHATDERGAPIAGLELEARTPSGATNQALTDEDGEAVVGVPLAILGKWNLTLSTRGTALLAPTTHHVPMHTGPLHVAADPKITPGQRNNVTIDLSINRRPLVNETVELSGPTFRGKATTNANGRAVVPIEPLPGIEPGPTRLELRLTRYNLVQGVASTILEVPQLDVDVLRPGVDGEDVVLRVVAVGDGNFLAGVPITVQARGAFESLHTARTGPDGTAELTLDRPRGADGVVAFVVRAEPTDTTAAAVQFASADVTPAPFPWWLVALILPAGAAVYAVRRYREKGHVAERAPPPGPSLELTIAPQQGTTLPPVWHTGEATELVVQLRDTAGSPIPAASVVLTGTEGTRRIQLDARGQARLPIPAPTGQAVNYHARFDGAGPHRSTETELEVRLVDYREEIDREYRHLRDESAELGLAGVDATPRELARAFGATPTANELALLFERCDYSLRPVDRGHYEAFMRAKESCLRHGRSRDVHT